MLAQPLRAVSIPQGLCMVLLTPFPPACSTTAAQTSRMACVGQLLHARPQPLLASQPRACAQCQPACLLACSPVVCCASISSPRGAAAGSFAAWVCVWSAGCFSCCWGPTCRGLLVRRQCSCPCLSQFELACESYIFARSFWSHRCQQDGIYTIMVARVVHGSVGFSCCIQTPALPCAADAMQQGRDACICHCVSDAPVCCVGLQVHRGTRSWVNRHMCQVLVVPCQHTCAH